MDAGCLKKQKMTVGEDRISELPDSLLHHILSFVPYKCAVSTSVLSERWKYVWVSVPVLDFRNWEPPRIKFAANKDYDKNRPAVILETNKFMDFVDKLMIQRNTLNIKKFYLDCNGHFDHKRVNAWITTAINCEIEEFIFSGIFSTSSDDKMIPDSLFTCESLTMLDFGLAYQDGLHLPDSFSLPKLRILRLTNIYYGPDDEKLVGKLFSSCPVLEELCLTDCSWEQVEIIRVSAPKLKSFNLTGCLRSNMDYIKVEIDAPKLLSFTFCDKLVEDFVVDSFPLLHDADLYYNYGDVESKFLQISKFITKLYNVKVLKISGAYFKILEMAKALSPSFPTFDNLNRLEIYDIGYLQMKTLWNFLDFSPNLESLVIKEVEDDDDDVSQEDAIENEEEVQDDKVQSSVEVNKHNLTFNKVPRFLEGLKSFEIRRFNGNPEELEIVSLVLKHARVLETVILGTSYVMVDRYQGKMKKNLEAKEVEALNKKIMAQLGASPWASSSCVIKFSSS